MNMRRIVLILLGLVVALGAGAFYFFGAPRLLSVYPADQAVAIASGTSLRLTFSNPMQAESVASRLSFEPATVGSFTWVGNTLVFNPTRPWPAGETIQVHLDKGARAVSWPPLPMRQPASWSFQVGEPRLAYLYPSDGIANVYIMDPTTGESRQITDSQASLLEFAVNANGTALYYSARNEKGGSDIYYLALNPGAGKQSTAQPEAPQQLVACGEALCRSPQISPQGDFLAYEKTDVVSGDGPNYPEVWLLPLAASGQACAVENTPRLASATSDQTMQPVWSPGGLLTFYDTNLSAFVVLNPDTQESTRFTNATGQPGAWDPAGNYFVAPEVSFINSASPTAIPSLDQVANSRLIRFNRQDDTTLDLTQGENMEDTSPAFSPDGKTLAFARKFLDVARWTPGRQLWLMSPDGKESQPLSDDPFYNHFAFAWSPAGGLLAYERFNQTVLTEPPEIWLMDTLIKRATRLVVGGFAPAWIP